MSNVIKCNDILTISLINVYLKFVFLDIHSCMITSLATFPKVLGTKSVCKHNLLKMSIPSVFTVL